MSQFSARHIEDVIDFSIGAPGKKLLEKACNLFQNGSVEFHGKCDEDKEFAEMHFQYGANCGSPVFLDSLSAFLASEYHDDKLTPDRLLLTSGATQGLHLVASTQIDISNGVVFVENPTYFIALDLSLIHI